MKKIISLVAVSVLFTSFSYSQLNSGSFFISGTTNLDLDLGSYKEVGLDVDKTKSTGFVITPKAGYFLKNRIAAGGLASFDFEGTKLDEVKTKDLSWYIGPFGRYYMEYGKIIPFTELSVALGGIRSISEDASASNKFTHSLFRAAAGVGVNFFLNDNFAFEGIIDYYYIRQKPTYEGATGEGNVESGISFNIGISFYFGKI